jgi:hypothetical protein
VSLELAHRALGARSLTGAEGAEGCTTPPTTASPTSPGTEKKMRRLGSLYLRRFFDLRSGASTCSCQPTYCAGSTPVAIASSTSAAMGTVSGSLHVRQRPADGDWRNNRLWRGTRDNSCWTNKEA